LHVDEIVAALASAGLFNPATGQPWSRRTVYGDMAANETQWAADVVASVGQHKARVLAELNEVKRRAWASDDGALVLKTIDRITSLLGLNAATRLAHEGVDGAPLPAMGPITLQIVAEDYRELIKPLAPENADPAEAPFARDE
jgi:hypothetical protein